MTIYNISVITSTGFPYYEKKIKNLPEGIKLYLRFFDFTENVYGSNDPSNIVSSFELNAGLISALYEFSKCINKKIRMLEFKSLNIKSKHYFQDQKKYKGDALITTQTETYLLHKSIKEKIKLIYDSIIFSKIPLETAYMINNEEEQKILDILTDAHARNHVINNQKIIREKSNEYLSIMGKYGLNNIVISSFDLSPIIVFGEKYSYKEIEIILRNIGAIPNINPMEWKRRQSFYKENQIWVYLINSGVGVTIKNLFEPFFYLLIVDSQSYLGELPGKITVSFNAILG
ncbi:MAG: hypothetical protein ACFFAN_15415 [Promethearchaeota archaeon]